jgi:hypothetical protein
MGSCTGNNDYLQASFSKKIMKKYLFFAGLLAVVHAIFAQEPYPLEEMDPPYEQLAKPAVTVPPGYEYNEYGYLITQNQAYWRKRGSNYARSFYENGKYGMKAQDGTVLIPALYDQIHYAYGGFMIAVKEGMSGVVNEANEVVIPFDYQFLEVIYRDRGAEIPKGVSLEDLRILARFEGDKVGILNGRGEVVSPFRQARLSQVQYFYDAPRNKDGYIQALPDDYQVVREGTALIYRFEGAGAVNANGDTLLSFEYDDITPLYKSNHPAWVQVEKDGRIGLFDLRGEWLLPIEYATHFDLLHRFTEKGNPSGPTLLIASMVVDTAAYGVEVVKWGLVDSTGREVLPFLYDGFGLSFRHGGKTFFFVEKDEKWGLVDSKNKVVIPFEHGKIMRHYTLDGKPCFSLKDPADQYYGLLSLDNELVAPFRYKWLDECNGQLLEFTDENGSSGLMNARGEEVLTGYSAFALLRGGYFQCVKDGLNGIVSPEGKLLLEPTFKSVYPENLLASFTSSFKAKNIAEADVITVMTSDEHVFAFLKNGKLVQLD